MDAYIQEFSKLAVALAKVPLRLFPWPLRCFILLLHSLQGSKADPGPSPPNYLENQWSLHFDVIFDATPSGKKFGDVETDANSSYTAVSALISQLIVVIVRYCSFFDMQNSSVVVEFWAGNPRNDLMVN